MAASYKNLPTSLKQALGSLELDKKVREIGAKYKLHIDDIGRLGTIVDDTIIGIVKLEDFAETLKRNLNIDEGTSKGLASEINAQIFQPVHDELMKIQENDTSGINLPAGKARNDELARMPNGQRKKEEENPDQKKELDDLHAALNPSFAKATEGAAPAQEKGQGETGDVSVDKTNISPTPDIHESKLTAPTQIGQKEIVIDHRTQNTLIPEDHKERINKDPYKENI